MKSIAEESSIYKHIKEEPDTLKEITKDFSVGQENRR